MKTVRFSRVLVFVAAGLGGLAVSSVPQAQDSSREVRDYLTRQGIAEADITRLENGEVVTALRDATTGNTEVAVVAAVRIAVPRAQVASYYGQVIAFVASRRAVTTSPFSSRVMSASAMPCLVR
jgi:hypothetical protein